MREGEIDPLEGCANSFIDRLQFLNNKHGKQQGPRGKTKAQKLFCSNAHSGFVKNWEIRNLRNNSRIRALIYRYLIKRFPRTQDPGPSAILSILSFAICNICMEFA